MFREFEAAIEDIPINMIGLLSYGMAFLAFAVRLSEDIPDSRVPLVIFDLIIMIVALIGLMRIFEKQFFVVRFFDHKLEFGVEFRRWVKRMSFERIMMEDIAHVTVTPDRRRIYIVLKSGRKRLLSMEHLMDEGLCQEIINTLKIAMKERKWEERHMLL